jgi:hypothetical protein
VYELVLQMIARYFAFGHETPEQRQTLAHVEAGSRRSRPVGPEPANHLHPADGLGLDEAAAPL